jgi:hypothetical protein
MASRHGHTRRMANVTPLHLAPLPPLADARLDVFPLEELSHLPPEAHAAIEQADEELAGRDRLVPHADVQKVLGDMRARQADCEACGGTGDTPTGPCTHCDGHGGLCTTCGKPWPACCDAGACAPADVRAVLRAA